MSSSRSKYSDEETITLANLNPGFGFRRFIDQLYPNTRKFSHYRYKFTMLFSDYMELSGVDLLGQLEDPSFDEFVPYDDYVRITGKKPKSSGGNWRRFGSNQAKFRVPPQNFDWGDITPESDRSHKN